MFSAPLAPWVEANVYQVWLQYRFVDPGDLGVRYQLKDHEGNGILLVVSNRSLLRRVRNHDLNRCYDLALPTQKGHIRTTTPYVVLHRHVSGPLKQVPFMPPATRLAFPFDS
jgi:hypothetical protein